MISSFAVSEVSATDGQRMSRFLRTDTAQMRRLPDGPSPKLGLAALWSRELMVGDGWRFGRSPLLRSIGSLEDVDDSMREKIAQAEC